jgi:hypothetical protein
VYDDFPHAVSSPFQASLICEQQYNLFYPFYPNMTTFGYHIHSAWLTRLTSTPFSNIMFKGFNLVIAACKALLEHGIELKLVTDKNPDAASGSGA